MKKVIIVIFIIILSLCVPAALAADEAVSRNIVVQSTQGNDIVLTKGTDKKFTAKAGTRLASGYTLTTGRDSYVWLKLDDDSTIKMNASTKIDISRASGKELKLTVINGSISFNAGEQAEGNKTSVKAGNSTMGLRGTLFTVTYIDGVMYVTLLDGSLEGSTPDGSYTLDAGNGMHVSDRTDDTDKVTDIYPLDFEGLDLFALETITENADMLLEGGIITEGEIERVNEIKEERARTEKEQKEEQNREQGQEQNQTGAGAPPDEKEKIYLPEQGNQGGGTPGHIINPVTYIVVFKDYDGRVLKTMTVVHGAQATPPAAPEREGYTFTGWDVSYENITGGLTVTALYSEAPSESYSVVFKDYDGTVLKTETVEHGASAVPPAVPEREGYVFTGWDVSYENITSGLTVTALYEEIEAEVIEVVFRDYDGTVIGSEQVQGTEDLPYPPEPMREGYTFSGWSGMVLEAGVYYVTAQYTINTYTVVFKDYDGRVLKTEPVEHGASATPPSAPIRAGYIFTGWDIGFGNVTKNLTLTAVYIPDDPIITASFTDANFLAEVRIIAGKPSGDILKSDVVNITNLNISSKSIANLAGIEHFEALEVLNCSTNLLTGLDVTNNPALTELNCNNNALTALDVTNNPALTTLWCFNNALTELNVTNNPALEYLYCSDNALTALDVTSNPALTRLSCDNNELTALDVTSNPALTLLNCAQNYIESTADVIGLSSIPGLSIFTFDPQKPIDITAKFTDAAFLAAVRTITGIPTDPIYNTDVNWITTLDVSSKGISSLEGIEYFAALEELYCNYNALTALDVTNNPALTTLWCYDNTLTALDVTNNPALTRLYCFNNALTELNVTNNPALEYLYCDDNALTALDVTNNTALTRLECYNNNLTALDVTNNAALTWLYCYNNALTELDVTNNPALTYLNCSNNYMTSDADVIGWTSIPGLTLGSAFIFDPQKPIDITAKFTDPAFLAAVRDLVGIPTDPIYNTDVSGIISLDVGNKRINSLAGIEYFTSLEELACTGDIFPAYMLVSLDVSKNTALTRLDIRGGFVRTLDLSNNPALTELWCDNNLLTELDLTNNPALTYLDCSGNDLTELDLTNNPALEYLDCGYNELTELDVTNNPALEYLDCSYNALTELDVTNNPALTMLNCSNNDLTTLDVSSNPALTTLYCSYNTLTALDVTNNPALTTLWCYDNTLTALDVTNNPALTLLNCAQNYIESTADVIGLSSIPGLSIFTFDPQKPLDITAKFTDPAFLAAVRTITGIPTDPIYTTNVNTITTLDVSSMGITSLAGIEYFTALTTLNCSYNSLTALDVTNNPALTTLDCSGNALTDLDVTNNTALIDLGCSNNNLTTLDVTNNPALEHLSCSNNALTALDVTNNTALTWLDCSGNLMVSTADVIGWAALGLTLGVDFIF